MVVVYWSEGVHSGHGCGQMEKVPGSEEIYADSCDVSARVDSNNLLLTALITGHLKTIFKVKSLSNRKIYKKKITKEIIT